MIIKRHKWGCIGHTLRKDESSVVRQAMQRNSLDGIGRRKGKIVLDVETNCGKRVQGSTQNLVRYETTGLVKSAVDS